MRSAFVLLLAALALLAVAPRLAAAQNVCTDLPPIQCKHCFTNDFPAGSVKRQECICACMKQDPATFANCIPSACTTPSPTSVCSTIRSKCPACFRPTLPAAQRKPCLCRCIAGPHPELDECLEGCPTKSPVVTAPPTHSCNDLSLLCRRCLRLTGKERKACLCKCKSGLDLDDCPEPICPTNSPTPKPTPECTPDLVRQTCPNCFAASLSAAAKAKCLCECKKEHPEVSCIPCTETTPTPTMKPTECTSDLVRQKCPKCFDTSLTRAQRAKCLCECKQANPNLPCIPCETTPSPTVEDHCGLDAVIKACPDCGKTSLTPAEQRECACKCKENDPTGLFANCPKCSNCNPVGLRKHCGYCNGVRACECKCKAKNKELFSECQCATRAPTRPSMPRTKTPTPQRAAGGR